jgi:hypothetical protein
MSLPCPSETKKQVDNFREAFSADIRKPFELKEDFPAYRKLLQSAGISGVKRPFQTSETTSRTKSTPQASSIYDGFDPYVRSKRPLTPPVSTHDTESESESSANQPPSRSVPMILPTAQELTAHHEQILVQHDLPSQFMDPTTWNPTKLFS